MAEDAARELPNLSLHDALQLVYLYAERGSPKFERRRGDGSIRRTSVPDGLPGVLVKPFLVYRQQPQRCNSVIGGYVYRGSEVPSLRGRYVYGDLCGGVRSVKLRHGKAFQRRREPIDPPDNLASFGEGIDGELFVVSFDGHVYRVT